MAEPTLRDMVLSLLGKHDGLTSQQILAELRKLRPSVKRETLYVCLSRAGKDKAIYLHLGVWNTWPECARIA